MSEPASVIVSAIISPGIQSRTNIEFFTDVCLPLINTSHMVLQNCVYPSDLPMEHNHLEGFFFFLVWYSISAPACPFSGAFQSLFPSATECWHLTSLIMGPNFSHDSRCYPISEFSPSLGILVICVRSYISGFNTNPFPIFCSNPLDQPLQNTAPGILL